MSIKRIVVLGSTGSIGINTLKVVERYPDKFKIIGLTAYSNFNLLETQIKRFSPKYVAAGENGVTYLKKRIDPKKIKILNADDELDHIVSLREVDIVVIAIRGSAALRPFLAAVRKGKIIAPANKEAIVIAGEILMKEARVNHSRIIPIDSEQSAIFQCLEGRDRSKVNKVYLTASGGPLLNTPKALFNKLSVKEILNHPRWRMGKKITVDSATLMNKGFEAIEAKMLFGLKTKQIEVLVHPEAIIHSMVEFIDGSILAQIGITDMRLPIQYALSYPDRFETGLKCLDFIRLKKLTFKKPDFRKFPSLSLAIFASEKGGTVPSVLNAADEEAVEAFLNKKIAFTKIFDVVEKIVTRHKNIVSPGLKEIISADKWAREEARKVLGQYAIRTRY